jgi:hypothetical protein
MNGEPSRSLTDGSDVWKMTTEGGYPSVGAADAGMVVTEIAASTPHTL